MRRLLSQLLCGHPFTCQLTRFVRGHERRHVVCLRCGKEF